MAQQTTKPMISVDVLGKMVRSLSARELSRLPIDKLPDHVPDTVYHVSTPEKNAILEDLLIRRDSERISRQVADLEVYGKQVAEALSCAEAKGIGPAARAFIAKVAELARIGSDTTGYTPQLASSCREARALFESVRSDPSIRAERHLLGLVRGRARLNDPKRIERALAALRSRLAPLESALANFQELNLDMAQREMSALRRRIKKESEHQVELQGQIDALRQDLERRQSLWQRAIGKFHASEEYASLQDRIRQLIMRKQMCEVLIDDEDLRRWLDAVVEASLGGTQRRADSRTHAARVLLLSLLELYCRQQESSAIQIAQNPFAQVDPKGAVRFALASERFILDYFAKKQEDGLMTFRSTAANRREQLDDLMQAIVKELKRNLRKLHH